MLVRMVLLLLLAVAPLAARADETISLDHDGQTRRYRLHLPRGLDPAQPVPLVVALHGGGGNMDLQADDARYGLIGKSDEAGFVVVFPNGFSRFPGGRLATWNAGACCGAARDRGSDDVGFIRAVVADVQRRVRIAPGRVYATGMSNGGMMAHRLACDAADLFSAIAAVAGTDNTTSCSPSRPVRVLVIHARDDDHVLYAGGAGPNAFRDRSQVTEFTSVPETIARWTKRNGCAAPPKGVLERASAMCEAYAGCRGAGEAGGAASVELCVTETGGHSWPGAAAVRRGKPGASQALVAVDAMWDFFEKR